VELLDEFAPSKTSTQLEPDVFVDALEHVDVSDGLGKLFREADTTEEGHLGVGHQLEKLTETLEGVHPFEGTEDELNTSVYL
jgi:hypothetical protein